MKPFDVPQELVFPPHPVAFLLSTLPRSAKTTPSVCSAWLESSVTGILLNCLDTCHSTWFHSPNFPVGLLTIGWTETAGFY